MRRDRGFILVNALLIVAALAAAAVLLLGRAEGARVRLDLAQEVAQAGLYLDGFEALALTVLDRDRGAGDADHLGEAWALSDIDVEVDRGRVAGFIRDRSGLFNLNMLAGEPDPNAQRAFRRLAEAIGLPESAAEAVSAHLASGFGVPEAYLRAPVPMRRYGEAVMDYEMLRLVPGLPEAQWRRLGLYATALPEWGALNVNTAPAEVLASLLPVAAEDRVPALVSRRRDRPFTSVEEFLEALGAVGDPETDPLVADRFAVESRWFLVETAATLGTTTLHRRSLVHRVEPGWRARVHHRLRMPE